MQQHDWSSANPKGPMSHLSLSPCTGIKFKTLMLAYRTATGSAPSYFHSLITIYIPSRSLRSASERHLVVPSQRGTKSLSRTFSFTVPGRWNELHSEQCLEICITSTSCVCLPLYKVLLIVFLNCKSLWIKASAKWINANVNENTHYMHSSAVLRVSRDLKLFHPRAYFLIFLLSYNTRLMLSSLWLIYLAKNI